MNLTALMDTVAYIDAGTGSYLLAAIASGAAGLWLFLRSGMVRLKRKVTGKPAPDSEPLDESGESAEAVTSTDVEEEPSTRG